MSYTELRSDWNVTQTETALQGTRAFIDATTSSCSVATLPKLGDQFSVAYPGLLVVSLSQVPYHIKSGGTNGYKWLVSYSSDPNLQAEEDVAYATKFSGGAKVESIKDPTGWYWQKHDGTAADGAITDQSIYRVSVSGTYSRVVYKDDSLMLPYVANTLFDAQGTLNDSTFDYFQRGTALFLSFNATPMNDKLGTKQWRITLNFSYLILDLTSSDRDVEHSWQYVLRDNAEADDPKYQKPMQALNSPSPVAPDVYLYNYSDFSTLL